MTPAVPSPESHPNASSHNHARLPVAGLTALAIAFGGNTAATPEHSGVDHGPNSQPTAAASDYIGGNQGNRTDSPDMTGQHNVGTVSPTDVTFPDGVQSMWLAPDALTADSPVRGAAGTKTKAEAPAPPKTLDFLPIPDDPELRALLNSTAYLNPPGCTAAIMPEGGAVTARHCGFRNLDRVGDMLTGADGRRYLVSPQPIQLRTGDATDSLTAVGDVASVILPTEKTVSGTDMDTAILVPRGRRADEVAWRYEAMSLSPGQARSLPQGTQLIMSGWPVDQMPADPDHSVIARQEMPMVVLGVTEVSGSNGDTVQVLMAAVQRNDSQAECSFGASGSQGWVKYNGDWLSVGSLAWFADLTGTVPWAGGPEQAQRWREEFAGLFNVDLGKTDALCGFSVGELQTGPGGNAAEYRIVPNRNAVPGYEGPATEADAPAYYAAQLADPTVTKVVLDAQLMLGGKGADTGATKPNSLERPLIFYNKFTNQVFGVGYDGDNPHQLLMLQYSDPGQVLLRSRSPHSGPPAVKRVAGSMTAKQSVRTTTGSATGGFVARDGTVAGYVTPYQQSPAEYYTLAVDDTGELRVVQTAGNIG